ncbi:prephenate dehydrogenase [Posidoniimonas polymericola]|uniref:Prephenate dehydrogenase n=1 Tax=Posidoniimonas polymericola TaxID=2528002 RepID=A0A5C5YPS4_9BACT|nr:prephenate dehydrogenase/arogenate dehydrogenase family protein [Posidoniimonas polymericola]TWT76873.1 prephenate dehydrogenase [Posidoniimonas polymericola]
MATFGVVAIIGPGLIGGSIGLGLKARGLADRVVGVVRSDRSAERAVQAGVVDQTTQDLAAAAAEADLTIVCTPVADVPAHCQQVAAAARSGAIITDAGSTKERLVAEVDATLAGSGVKFVGSHPLAGDHKSGPESARAELLAGRVVVVTPTDQTDSQALSRVCELWTALGARVEPMSPVDHDAALARTSHAPHVIATALANATPEDLLGLTGGGWRDTTRVAAGSPTLWRDILLDNPQATLAALDAFSQQLGRLQQAIADHDRDAIYRCLEEGKLRRDALGS